MLSRAARPAVVAGVAFGICGSAPALTYYYHFDSHPGGKYFDWDDVAGPHSYLNALMQWQVDDTAGVNGGGAMRIRAADAIHDYIYQDYRSIQINAEPGTTIRIQFDVRVAAQDTGGLMRVRYYDGYCSALSFYDADGLGSPYPPPFFEHTSGTDDTWRHVDHTTPVLANSTFTLVFHFEDLVQPLGSPLTGDYLIDNLRIDFTPQTQLRDPLMDWSGIYGSTFNEWRLNGNGAHVAWCDWMEERDHFFDAWCEKQPVTFNYEARYDTTSRATEIFAKQDLDHKDIPPWGSIFRIDNTHDASRAKIYGIRQTVSYDAILPPGAPGSCTVQAEMATYDAWNQQIARFWLGVDPLGGREPKEESYPDCVVPPTGCCDPTNVLWNNQYLTGYFRNIYVAGKTWKLAEVNWERPQDAEAFTIYLKCMDWRQNTGGGSELADFLVRAVAASGTPSPDPYIWLSPSSLEATTCRGTRTASQTLTIKNGNAGTGTINYTITDDAEWLSVAPATGDSSGEEDQITVSYDSLALPSGTYTANITVVSAEASNSPRQIPVTLTIRSAQADFDDDGDVETDDFGFIQRCLAPTASIEPGCEPADLDGDSDIDADDIIEFSFCAYGPALPTLQSCCE